jgi:outer membrane protein
MMRTWTRRGLLIATSVVALLFCAIAGQASERRASAALSPPPPFPVPTFGPADAPTSLPYPAYGTSAPGVRNMTVAPGVGHIITLEQAIRIGFARSPLLAAARANEALAHAGVVLQQAGLLPLVTGVASTTRSIGQTEKFTGGGGFANDITSNGVSVSLQQLVYDGGKTAAEIHAAKQSEVAQIDTYRRTLQTTAYTVAQAYYTLLAAQRTTSVDVEDVRENLVQEDLVRAQVRAGTEARSDIATAELPVAQARLALVQAQGAEISAQAAFANAMGLDADVDVLPADDTPIFTRKSIETIATPTYAKAIQRGIAMRPDYDAAQRAVNASEATLRAARRSIFPTLSGSASTGTSSTNPQAGAYRNASSLGLQLSVPLFAPGIVQSGIEQARAELDASRAQFVTEEQTVQLNIKQALASFVSARSAVDEADAEYVDASTVLQSTQAQYRAGVTTLPLLLNAEVGYTTALSDQVKTVYSLRQAEQAFLYAEGENDLQQSRTVSVRVVGKR